MLGQAGSSAQERDRRSGVGKVYIKDRDVAIDELLQASHLAPRPSVWNTLGANSSVQARVHIWFREVTLLHPVEVRVSWVGYSSSAPQTLIGIPAICLG